MKGTVSESNTVGHEEKLKQREKKKQMKEEKKKRKEKKKMMKKEDSDSDSDSDDLSLTPSDEEDGEIAADVFTGGVYGAVKRADEAYEKHEESKQKGEIKAGDEAKLAGTIAADVLTGGIYGEVGEAADEIGSAYKEHRTNANKKKEGGEEEKKKNVGSRIMGGVKGATKWLLD